MPLLFAFILAASPANQDELARAEKLLEQRNFAAAETILREIAKSEPSNSRAQGNLVLALLPQGKLREAVDAGRLAAAFGPRSAEARFIYGLALRAAGRNLEAAREFEKALSLKPEELGPLEALADSYAASGDERATAVYERLLAREPGRRDLRLGFAEHLWSLGNNGRGGQIAAAALEDFPDFGQLRVRYGRALFDEQRFLDAAQQLSRARDLGVGDAATLGLLGNALWQAGRIEEARLALETAVRAYPDAPNLHRDLGRLLLSQGEGDAALIPLEAAARLSPRDASASFDLGRAREAVGRLAEAEEAYTKAKSLSPGLASPRYALGRLLVRQGRREEGEVELAVYRTLYARAAQLQFETESRRSEILLAESELSQGRAAAALARLESLPEGVDVLTGRARALSRLNRHREAIQTLERARELQPDELRIQALLAAERARAQEKR
ncbi:MAG: tetratricopeptide repeat protein [Acidobacteriota bacterium]